MAVVSRVADEGFYPYHLPLFTQRKVYNEKGKQIDTSAFRGCYIYPFDSDFIPLSSVLHIQAGREGQKVWEKEVKPTDKIIMWNARVKRARMDKWGGGMDWEPIVPDILPMARVLLSAEKAYENALKSIERVLDAGLDWMDFELADAVLIIEEEELK